MNEREETLMLPENKHESDAEVNVVSADGLGFGEGSISVQDRIKNGEITTEGMTVAIDIVKNDGRVWTHVEADDDGCGDGRGTSIIYRFLDKATGNIERFKRSLKRAKIFGGGLIASASMWRAADGSPSDGKTLAGDRAFMANQLRKRGINYGAHTDEHAEGEKCGCGAIDKYTDVSGNVIAYRREIMEQLPGLYGDSFADNAYAVENVFGMYAELNDDYYSGVTGKDTMDEIEKDGAVVKQLRGGHKEALVVLNDVEGMTLDQEKLDEILKERGVSEEIQAFAVDIWRGRMYADAIADIYREMGKNDEECESARKRAYADFLIRTLSVSATLTKGDQPVLLRAPKPELVAA